MKKFFSCVFTLVAFIMLMSCQGSTEKGKNKEKQDNPLTTLDSILDDVNENGTEWDYDQWESVLRDVAELHLSFWESEPTKQDIKDFDKLGKKFSKALTKVSKSEKAEKAFKKAYEALEKDHEFMKLIKDADKAETKARKAAEKADRNADDEE